MLHEVGDRGVWVELLSSPGVIHPAECRFTQEPLKDSRAVANHPACKPTNHPACKPTNHRAHKWGLPPP